MKSQQAVPQHRKRENNDYTFGLWTSCLGLILLSVEGEHCAPKVCVVWVEFPRGWRLGLWSAGWFSVTGSFPCPRSSLPPFLAWLEGNEEISTICASTFDQSILATAPNRYLISLFIHVLLGIFSLQFALANHIFCWLNRRATSILLNWNSRLPQFQHHLKLISSEIEARRSSAQNGGWRWAQRTANGVKSWHRKGEEMENEFGSNVTRRNEKQRPIPMRL